ncbi:DNA-binding SARP family transcriptional activator [Nakamurella sp. UYEF19]|uniref:BTAD domain-containing putative transcriptional regulator n=1 Tax=Nakamurella sp. UYEF19 TaxID=1756392 RepID=UPI003393AB4B
MDPDNSASPSQPPDVGITAGQRAIALGAQVDALLAAGEDRALCQLVAVAFAERSDAGDLPEVAALISALSDEVLAAYPKVLLELARACDAEARVRLRYRLLDRAEALAVVGPEGEAFALALEAERIADLARDFLADQVEARFAVLDRTLETERAHSRPTFATTLMTEAKSRASHALGRVLSWRGDPLSLTRAEDALQVAAGAARALGRSEWRAQSLLTLGYSVYFERGEEIRGVARLQEGMDLLPVGHPRRAGIGTFLAEVLVRSHTGTGALPLLEQIRFEAAETGDQRSLGYAAWIMALLSAELGDAAATLEWLAEAERHPGDWFEHSTGGEFMAEAAMSAERIGEPGVADRYLARAVERADADGFAEVAWFASGMINARRGDPVRAIADLTRLLDEPWFPPRDLWLVWLHLALARLRSDDEQGAGQDAARGFEAASALVGPGRAAPTAADLPALLSRLEADLVRRLGPIAAAAGSVVAAALQPANPRVRLFGGLAVSVGGTAVAVPQGRPAQLLILLATARMSIPIDVAIDELWPEVTGDVGRRRMRNVLTRIRASCGELVARNGESLLLAPGTEVDVTEFERACDRADRARPGEKASLAAAAAALYREDLLPEAAYAPRVLRLKDQLEYRAIGLLEVVATAAERSGRYDDAARALGRIAELDPYDEDVVLRGADMLRKAGRPDQAALWLERAERLLQE